MLDQIIYGRRSLYPRQYSGERIDDEVIRQILEYANTAPNHKKTEPWRFIVFSDQSKDDLIDFMKQYYVSSTNKEEISQKKLDSFSMKKEKTSHIIGIVMKRDEAERVPEIEEIAAVSCAVQNLYLSLNTFDLAGYWSTGKIMFSEEIRNYLNIDGKDRFLGFFYLGKVGVDVPLPQRSSVESKITWKK